MMSSMKTYGLIGQSLAHSFSPNFFKEKFEREQIEDAQYLSFPLNSILDFPKLIKEYQLSGLNVTIPYKQEVIPFLDDLSEEAKAIRAVNCIAFNNGSLTGYNTDIIGFEKSISPLINKGHSQAMVLGSGGAAQAVIYVLGKLNIPSVLVSRRNEAEFISYEEAESRLNEFPIIINTTPLGMHPDLNACPFKSMEGMGKEHLVYDLIYNPQTTRFLALAAERGATIKNGQEMLEIQAIESWKIWNPK